VHRTLSGVIRVVTIVGDDRRKRVNKRCFLTLVSLIRLSESWIAMDARATWRMRSRCPILEWRTEMVMTGNVYWIKRVIAE